jgi:hypothetical protein
MNKSIESLSKLIFILSLFGIAYGIYTQQKMFTIYSIGGLGLGYSILAFAYNNFKIEQKEMFSILTALLLPLSCSLFYKDKFIAGGLLLTLGLVVLLYPFLSKKTEIKQV